MTHTSLITGSNRQKVVFRCHTHDATPVLLSGDVADLGAWSVAEALVMHAQQSTQGRYEWTAQVELPLGHTVEYKFVKSSIDGVRWETGHNHRITIIPGLHTINADFRD